MSVQSNFAIRIVCKDMPEANRRRRYMDIAGNELLFQTYHLAVSI